MNIPTGDWIVVAWHVHDTRSKGDILTGCTSKECAQTRAKTLNAGSTGSVSYWAIPRIKYDKPWSGSEPT